MQPVVVALIATILTVFERALFRSASHVERKHAAAGTRLKWAVACVPSAVAAAVAVGCGAQLNWNDDPQVVKHWLSWWVFAAGFEWIVFEPAYLLAQGMLRWSTFSMLPRGVLVAAGAEEADGFAGE